jgi:hypothetical protein
MDDSKFGGSRTCWLEDIEVRVLPRAAYARYASLVVWHMPTGIAIVKENERSLLQNRVEATEQLRIILHTLYPDAP